MDMFEGSEIHVMMSCHARSGNEAPLCMQGVFEICTKDIGTRHCIEFVFREKSWSYSLLDFVCKF